MLAYNTASLLLSICDALHSLTFYHSLTEFASSKRAGCKNPECKAKGDKIAKGELRFCTWVSFGQRGESWQYRHWLVQLPILISSTAARAVRHEVFWPDLFGAS